MTVELDKDERYMNDVLNSGSSEHLYDSIECKTNGNDYKNKLKKPRHLHKRKKHRKSNNKRKNSKYNDRYGEQSEFSLSNIDKPLPPSNPTSDDDHNIKRKTKGHFVK